jgi:hypothetical protein
VSRLFALDQNFPQPILDSLDRFIPEAKLVPLADIDIRLIEDTEDWEVLLALHHHARPWDGVITADSSMLNLPRELAVLMQTKLTLVVAEESAHDPLRASGLVLLHLPGICARTRPDVAQVWRLRAPSRKPHKDPWDELTRVAEHKGTTPAELYEEAKLSPSDLARDPLAPPGDTSENG